MSLDVAKMSGNPWVQLAAKSMKDTLNKIVSQVARQVQFAYDTGKCPQCGKVISRIKKKASKLEEKSPIAGHIVNHYLNLYTADGRIRKCVVNTKQKKAKSKSKNKSKNKQKGNLANQNKVKRASQTTKKSNKMKAASPKK